MKHLVISSMPRSGSTLIAEMVGKHPAVLGLTEVFNDDEGIRKKCHHRVIRDNGLFAYEGGEYGRPDLYLDFLENVARRNRKSVVSFKVMESQCPTVYGWLNMRDTTLVRINRPNLLAMAVSWKMAMQTNVWHITQPEEREKASVGTVIIELCELEEWAQRERDQREIVKRTRMKVEELSYAEIKADPRGAVDWLFDLIEVMRIDVEPTMLKTNERELWHLIANWDQLARHFKGTPQEWWLSGEEADPNE